MSDQLKVSIGCIIETTAADLQKQLDSLTKQKALRFAVESSIDGLKLSKDIVTLKKTLQDRLGDIGKIEIGEIFNKDILKGFSVYIKDSYDNVVKLVYQLNEATKAVTLLNQAFSGEGLTTGLQKSLQDLKLLEDRLISLQNETLSGGGILLDGNFNQIANDISGIFSNLQGLKDSLDIPDSAKTQIDSLIESYKQLYEAKIAIGNTNESTSNNLYSQLITSMQEMNALQLEMLSAGTHEQKVIEDRINLEQVRQQAIQAQLSDNDNVLRNGEKENHIYELRLDLYSKLEQAFARMADVDDSTRLQLEQQINVELDKQEDAVNQTAIGMNKLNDNVGNTAAGLFTLTQAFYLLKKFISDSIEYLINLDNSLNEIRIVTNMTVVEAENLGKKYNQMAKDMKVSTKELTSAAVEYYRQGLDDNAVVENLKETIVYSKIAKVEMSNAAEIITASMNSMDVSAERAIDVFSLLGDATATGADEIGKAMQKTGGAIGALNIPFEKAASWIAVISSKTRENAEIIGTSVNSILARLRQLKEKGYLELENGNTVDVGAVSKALAKVDIELINSQTKEFNDFGLVMDQIGAKWESLDESLQAYISTTLAGTYQQSRFYSLMEGYSESVDLYNEALNSAGIANDKFKIYQESSQAALDEFRATWEETAMNLINGDFLKDMIHSGTKLMEVLASIAGFLNSPIGNGAMVAVITTLA